MASRLRMVDFGIDQMTDRTDLPPKIGPLKQRHFRGKEILE
jgi:hypothetical protein